MSLDTVPEQLTRLKAQLTALAMEKQALLEDIAVGNSARRTSGRHRTGRSPHYPAARRTGNAVRPELKLTEQLLACRSDISRQAEIPDLQQELRRYSKQPITGPGCGCRTVATVIADWTGVPLSSLMKDEQTELLTLEEQPGKRVVGQDAALNAIAQRLRASKTGLTPENGPQGCFYWWGQAG
jgi:type VI secretion system protein VasG